MTDKKVDYKGYNINPKRDFGSYGFLIKEKTVSKGFVVTDKHNVNVMPGATWFQTIKDAKNGINVLIKYGEKNFWKGLKKEDKKMSELLEMIEQLEIGKLDKKLLREWVKDLREQIKFLGGKPLH